MNEPQEISISTVCNGGVPEVFERGLREVLANITDPSTEASKARGITLKFTITPTDDRLSATVAFTCRSVLQPVQVARSPLFLSRHSGELKAYALDQRQIDLFGGQTQKTPTVTISK